MSQKVQRTSSDSKPNAGASAAHGIHFGEVIISFDAPMPSSLEAPTARRASSLEAGERLHDTCDLARLFSGEPALPRIVEL